MKPEKPTLEEIARAVAEIHRDAGITPIPVPGSRFVGEMAEGATFTKQTPEELAYVQRRRKELGLEK